MKKPFSPDNYLKELQIQDYFSLGYIFLIILGLVSNVIYWTTLGINIFDYTSISDILITPLSIIFQNLKTTLAFIIGLTIMYYFLKYNYPKHQKKLAQKAEKENRPFKEQEFQPITGMIFMFSSVFLGFNIGKCFEVKNKVQNQDYTVNKVIKFSDNTEKEVFSLGQNSVYIFYVDKSYKDINIVPIDGNIKSIRHIHISKK
jgi:hypothetical protein